MPLAPQRIASLCGAATDSLVALGVRPILVQGGSRIDGAQLYLADSLKGVAVMPPDSVISLEAVLAAKPDLIFASNMQNGKLYGQLSKIAPTVFIGSTGDGYRENRILDVGEVLGMQEKAERRLADTVGVWNGKRTVIVAGQERTSRLLAIPKEHLCYYTRTAMFGPLLFEQLGLTPDPAMPEVMMGGGWDVLSIERLSDLRAEHIFMTIDPDSELYLQGVAKTPDMAKHSSSAHDHVHRIASSTWLSGDGVLGCEAILNDILAAMAPERSPSSCVPKQC